MNIKKTLPKNIDDYIEGFPEEIQSKLQQVRTTIKETAPDAKETIGYGIPTFKLNGNLVHFAAFKNHIGFYPTPTGIEEFEKELSVYKQGKGSVQFPLDKPMPLGLISKIVKYRVKRNYESALTKKSENATPIKDIRTCSKGHQYYKSSDCPTCPVCEKERKPEDGFLSVIPSPARRALESKGITSLDQLSKYSEFDILKLHGMGPGSIPKLTRELRDAELSFRKK